MRRDFDPQETELMDRDQPVTPELEAELRNLASINRNFGGHRLVRKFLELWLNPGRCYRVLDLCTGGGDGPRAMVDWARKHDILLRVDAVDATEASLEIARAESADYPEIQFIQCNALKYECKETYDIVLCSLALHHFPEEQAVALLRRCRELSHHFVLVADLERSLATLAGVYLLTTLFYPEASTCADGVLSARRAFSFAEFQELAVTAGWHDFGHARFLVCRQALWLDMRELAEIPIGDTGSSEVLPCPT